MTFYDFFIFFSIFYDFQKYDDIECQVKSQKPYDKAVQKIMWIHYHNQSVNLKYVMVFMLCYPALITCVYLKAAWN